MQIYEICFLFQCVEVMDLRSIWLKIISIFKYIENQPLSGRRLIFMLKSHKKVTEKFGSLKIKRTFALPFEKRVSDKGIEFLPRLTLKNKIFKFFAEKFGD